MEKKLFKDTLDLAYIERTSRALAHQNTHHDAEGFIRDASTGLEQLELKGRVTQIARALHEHLPGADYPTKLEALRELEAAHEHANDRALQVFEFWPLTAVISEFGEDHPEESLELLSILTSKFTGEFDIRVFLEAHREHTMTTLEEWVTSPDEHVRRLVSEGTRPFLPWGVRVSWLDSEPDQVFGLLEQLKDDPSEYVRRSVANNLNDYTRNNADQVIELLTSWSDGASDERAWLIKHALRSLIKKGDPRALELLGFSSAPEVNVVEFSATEQVELGEHLELTIELESMADHPQPLVVDFIIHHVKANGELRPKVFKLKTFELGERASKKLSKRHGIKKITTRKYYAGEHKVELVINGEVFASQDFTLSIP